MNAFYVTVSIPLLLVLAGFNHAHGLTTFGKSQPQSPEKPDPNIGKLCKEQSDCLLNRYTTCLKGRCLCGNNVPPENGKCTEILGPNHICSKNEDCVDNADCISVRDIHEKTNDIAHLLKLRDTSICRCQEGYAEVGATCGGGTNLGSIPFILVAVTIYKIFN